MSNQKDDLEALLYPSMQESPEHRWAFIRKVYSILTTQLLTTIVVAAIVASHQPIATFFSSTPTGLAIYIVIIIIPFIVICLLYIFQNKHPLNFFLLGIFTLCFGFAIGVISAFIDGKIILEAVITTMLVVISLTLYTFWAAKRGQDFGFLLPFLLAVLVILSTFTLFQIFYPVSEVSEMIYSGLAVLVFCAYIIYDTDTLIRRNSYDEYIWASVSLYLDVLNVFVRLLQIFKAADRS